MLESEKRKIAKEISEQLSVSQFPSMIESLIEDYCRRYNTNITNIAKLCNLPDNSLRRIRIGESVSAQQIWIIGIVLNFSFDTIYSLICEAQWNTTHAYMLLKKQNIDIDDYDDIINMVNKKIKSNYKIDEVRRLYRKQNHLTPKKTKKH